MYVCPLNRDIYIYIYKQKQNQTEIWRFDWFIELITNARGCWFVKRTLGWKNFMPENFLEIDRYFALTSHCNTIGQLNNAFSILGFLFGGKTKSPCFDLSIHWLIKQITDTYRNHFLRSYENCCNKRTVQNRGVRIVEPGIVRLAKFDILTRELSVIE